MGNRGWALWVAGMIGCGGASELADVRQAIDDLVAEGDGACAAVEDCASLGIGAKPCGGPSEYVVYCATAVNEAALEDLAETYHALAVAENERTNAVSDCSLVSAPLVELVDGTCTAAPM